MLVEAIAHRRGKWVYEVLELTFEQFSYEVAAFLEYDAQAQMSVAQLSRNVGPLTPVYSVR